MFAEKHSLILDHVQMQCQLTFFGKLKTQCLNSISELQQASLLNLKVASGRTVKVLAQAVVKIEIIGHQFDEVFLILPSMNSVVLGNPFFKQYKNLLGIPVTTYQLNEIKNPTQGWNNFLKTKYTVCLLQKTVIRPQQQESLYAKIDVPKELESHTATVIPDEDFEGSTDLKLSSAVIKVGKDKNGIYQLLLLI